MSIHLIKKNKDIIKDIDLLEENTLKGIIKEILKKENKKLGEINIIIQTDKEELKINKKYLKHDYYTDVIAFQYNKKNIINGDIFISIEKVKRNAKEYNEELRKELSRVIIHGILHLIGYNDKEKSEKYLMKEKEDLYLKKLYERGV